MPPTPKQCYRCMFGQRCPANKASYSSVLYCGLDTSVAWQQHAEWARSNPVLGVTAYCQQCKLITWIADDADHNSALVHSLVHRQRLQSAEAGMKGLCTAT